MMEKLIFLVMVLVGITGIINGFFLFFYLFFVYSKKNRADKFLAFLVLFLTIRMAKSIISSIIPVNFIIIHIGLAAFASIGPMLLFYIRKSINPKLSFSLVEFFHLVPALLVLLCVLLPYPQDDPIWNLRYNLIMLQILVYLLLAGSYFINKRNHYIALPYKKSWYLFITGSVSLIWLSYGITWWIGILPYLSGTFLFCLFVYMLLYLWLNKKQINESFERYKNSVLSKTDSEILFLKLKAVMKSSKPFLDNEITLPKLASKLETKPHLLSQVINENFNTNFFDFMNSYRIDEIKERLVSSKFSNHTIAAIAYDCGFNSISSFNSAFKKKEKLSPSKYREKYYR